MGEPPARPAALPSLQPHGGPRPSRRPGPRATDSLSFSLLAQGSHAGAGFGSARPRGAGLLGAEGTAGRPRASPPSRFRRSLWAARAEQPPPVTSTAEMLSAGGSAELSRCFSQNRRLYQVPRHAPLPVCGAVSLSGQPRGPDLRDRACLAAPHPRGAAAGALRTVRARTRPAAARADWLLGGGGGLEKGSGGTEPTRVETRRAPAGGAVAREAAVVRPRSGAAGGTARAAGAEVCAAAGRAPSWDSYIDSYRFKALVLSCTLLPSLQFNC